MKDSIFSKKNSLGMANLKN